MDKILRYKTIKKIKVSNIQVVLGSTPIDIRKGTIYIQEAEGTSNRTVHFKSKYISFNIWYRDGVPFFVVIKTPDQTFSTCSNHWYRSKCYCTVEGYMKDRSYTISGKLCQGSSHIKLYKALEYTINWDVELDYIILNNDHLPSPSTSSLDDYLAPRLENR